LSNIISLINKHIALRSRSLNLVASENILSKTALSVLSTDLNGRYAAELYGGTKVIREIINKTEESIRELFKAEYANVKPISGTVSVLSILLAFTRTRDKVGILHFKDGGFPLNIEGYERKPVYMAYDATKLNLEYNKTIEILDKEKPKLVFLGASRILFPQPVKEIAEFVHDYGGIVAFDGSHVLGLICGGRFQDPLREGVDILIGSTHKTFPGPQGGLIVTNDKNIRDEIWKVLSRPYMLVDNPHVARIAALGVTAEEMKKFGHYYAESIIQNSKALAKSLEKLGLKVKGKELGYTESHQLLLGLEIDTIKLKDELEKYNIFIDAIGRIGTQEITRRGMSEKDMSKIAEFVHRAIENIETYSLKEEISEFAQRFNKVEYSFDER